jgi:hypothetical protein
MCAREPSSEADLARGGALLCHLGGPQGATKVTIAWCVCFRFVGQFMFCIFLRVLSEFPLVV